MSTKDELTGLFNRRYFHEALEGEIDRARRYQTGFAVFIADLDHFKTINDTYGHPAGTDTTQSLIQKADDALYKAKADGRNRVILYPDFTCGE